jgi:hypothetical protein
VSFVDDQKVAARVQNVHGLVLFVVFVAFAQRQNEIYKFVAQDKNRLQYFVHIIICEQLHYPIYYVLDHHRDRLF